MAIKVKRNKGKDGKEYDNLDFSDADKGDSITIELKFDAPKTFPGRFPVDPNDPSKGMKVSSVFNVKVIEPFQNDNVSFFGNGRTNVFGKDLAGVLSQYGRGTRVKMDYDIKKGKRGYFGVWNVTALNASQPTLSQAVGTKPDAETEALAKEIIDLFPDGTGSELEIRETLRESGVTDEFKVQAILEAYDNAYAN